MLSDRVFGDDVLFGVKCTGEDMDLPISLENGFGDDETSALMLLFEVLVSKYEEVNVLVVVFVEAESCGAFDIPDVVEPDAPEIVVKVVVDDDDDVADEASFGTFFLINVCGPYSSFETCCLSLKIASRLSHDCALIIVFSCVIC